MNEIDKCFLDFEVARRKEHELIGNPPSVAIAGFYDFLTLWEGIKYRYRGMAGMPSDPLTPAPDGPFVFQNVCIWPTRSCNRGFYFGGIGR